MRIGPWVLAAGMGLLCAGVVSSRAEIWAPPTTALTIPLVLDGIDTIDIRESGISKLVISGKDRPQVHYPELREFLRSQGDEPLEPPSCKVSGSTLRCVAGQRYMPGNPTMHLPPGRYRLLADGVEVASQVDLEAITLEIDHGYMNWTGPVGELTVNLRAHGSTGDSRDCDQPTFRFQGGRVGNLRVLADAGGVGLNDLSGVANIEVQAGGKVGLSVANAVDIPRIHLTAVPEGAREVDAKGQGAAGACRQAMDAAALAAMR